MSAKPLACSQKFERAARQQGFARIAGVDEVGRGCLFGPVHAAAVILDPDQPIQGLRDSKQLDLLTRTELAAKIRKRAVAYAVASASVEEIAQLNILHAARLAMKRAVEMIAPLPDYLLVDAVRVDLPIEQLPLIKGDARCQSIAAASILAKVERDDEMLRWHEIYPDYGLAANKGYGTPEHLRALRRHGPTPLHRRGFAPVSQLELFHSDLFDAGE